MATQTTASARWQLLALSLAMLLPSLGTSIANVALPTLATSFGSDFSDVQWVVIAYLLSVTTLIVGAGRLGDLFGRRRMLLAGIAIFTVASLACAVSPTLWFLIAARTLQGAGAAFMMSLTIASVADTLPKDQTGRAMGLLGTVSAVGTALGPSLGGALIAWGGWPSVFALIAALGVASFLLGSRLFQGGAPPSEASRGLDAPGFLLLAIALGAYSLSMTSGANFPVYAGVAVVALATFIVVESRSAQPLLRLDSLRNGPLSGSLLALSLVTTIVMATLVVGPFYLMETAGLNPAQAGLVMSIGPAISALVGVPAGRLVDEWGAGRATLAGLIASTMGCLLMVMLPTLVGISGYVASLALITGGYALFQAANNTSVMKGAPVDLRGVVSALLGLARNLGLITGASAMGAIFAMASNGLPALGLQPGGNSGLQATFLVGAVLAGAAVLITLLGRATERNSNSNERDVHP